MRRLGFAVKVLGRPGLKEHDSRRWQNNPHLSVSLAYLRDIFEYLRSQRIRMYRISSDLAPYLTHPDMPQFHGQIEECAVELEAVGRLAQEADLRLSFHPSQYVLLNAPDEDLARRSAMDLNAQAEILERMGLGPEAVVVTHVGGVYDGHEAARERFVRRFERLPELTRRRLVLENDDQRFSVADVLWIHRRTGLRLVFDNLHHYNCNPEGMPLREALAACLATWPADVTPKVHFSSPRTEMRVAERKDPATGRKEAVLQPPDWTNHSDYVNPFEFIAFLREAAGLRPFDVMLEAKAKDLALLRLREDLARFAPDLAETIQ
ncbi:MAG: UV DNA damage repair endonuclease UvsE [Caldilineales bacterium]|nr:UV DNA damage repair endonuclease UvsE [Caldilineales bacterium]MDW8318285.1 UV DNA damage repair endonuclease UvsE [Anaerolineae bacterium]